MATSNKMETLGDLQRFKEALLANVDKLTPYEESRVKFSGLVSGAQERNREQAALTAAKQEASRQFEEELREAQRLATVLRVAIRELFGPDSEKLVEFGLKPFRGKSRKKKEPEVPLPEAPAPATAE